jgi:hypothetical protein
LEKAPDFALFYDYEVGRLRCSVVVFDVGVEDFDFAYDFDHPLDNPCECRDFVHYRRPRDGVEVDFLPERVETVEDLKAKILDRFLLWTRPFVIAIAYVWKGEVLFLDKGVRSTVLKRKLFFEALMSCIPRKWVRLRRRKDEDGKVRWYANAVGMTVTCPRDMSLRRAYRWIRRRCRRIMRYFDERYGLRDAFFVIEAHEDGYPHAHGVLFLRDWVRTYFNGEKKRWEFYAKKDYWESDLRAKGGRFIDCFAFKSMKHVLRYFAKYVTKSFSSVFEDAFEVLTPVLKQVDENCYVKDVDSVKWNFKKLTVFVLRALRVNPFIVSDRLYEKAKVKLKELLETWPQRKLRRVIDRMNELNIEIEEDKRRGDLEALDRHMREYVNLDVERRKLLDLIRLRAIEKSKGAGNDLIQKSSRMNASPEGIDPLLVVPIVLGYVEFRECPVASPDVN